MDRLLRLLLTVCLALSTTSLVAQDRSPGFLARAATREGGRLAAEPPAPARQINNASTGVLELRWSELAPLLQGTRVDITLTDGTMLHGEILALRDDGLVMDVSSSSKETTYRRGSGMVPRVAVSLIRLERSRGAWGRHLGTVIGVLSGVVIGAYVTGRAADSASLGIPLFLSVASGITVAGYYGGRRLDRRVTTIRVMP